MSELKLCPKCKGKNIEIFEYTPTHWFRGHCTDCNYSSSIGWFKTPEEAEREWNTRPVEDAMQVEIEDIKLMLKKANDIFESCCNHLDFSNFIEIQWNIEDWKKKFCELNTTKEISQSDGRKKNE